MDQATYLKIGRTHHLAPPIVYGTLSSLMILFVVGYRHVPLLSAFLTILIGLFSWTIIEYVLHRFPFHAQVTQEPFRLFSGAGFHQLHHEIPNRGDYVVAPLLMSLPTYAIIMTGLYLVVRDLNFTLLFSSGVALGYLAYEWVHYFTHHGVAKTSVGRYLKKYHMLHHFKDSQNYFGVSSPFWDIVFGTNPEVDYQKETEILPITSRSHS